MAIDLSKRQLREACAAWQSGGTLGLGLWLSKHTPRFTVAQYGDLVAMVRVELNDSRDYSQEA
jgi:hypothetical protein